MAVGVPDNKATFKSQKENLKKEALRLRKLSNPHIVRVHNLFEENGMAYYVMEYAKNGSLAEKMKKNGCLTEPVATR